MKKIVSLLCAALLMLAAGCGTVQKSQSETVSIGLLPLTSSAPLFIGLEKGFFREEGLDVKPVWFGAAQPITVAAASNTIDVGATGLTASLYNMAAAGRPVIITADKGREVPKFPSSVLIVRSDSPFQSLSDLKGHSFAMTTAGSSFEYMMGRMMSQEGMHPEDIRFLPLRSLGSVMAAVKTGKADSAIVNEPNGTKAERAGWARIIAHVGDTLPYQTSAVFYSPAFSLDHDRAVRFMKAYIRSCRWYYDHVLTASDRQSPDYQEGIAIISRYTKAPPADVMNGLPWIDRDGRLMEEDIPSQIQWYQKEHLVTDSVPTIMDMSYWQEAEKELS